MVDETDKAAIKAKRAAAAQRALEEAAERRKAREAEARKREVNGRDGPEPTRYGDWEKDGIISDF